MANTSTSETDLRHPMVYQIRIQGHLDPDCSDLFSGLTITTLDNGHTLLTGSLSIKLRCMACSEKCGMSDCN